MLLNLKNKTKAHNLYTACFLLFFSEQSLLFVMFDVLCLLIFIVTLFFPLPCNPQNPVCTCG